MDNNSDMSMESNSYSYPESDMDKPRLEKVYIQASLHADELPGKLALLWGNCCCDVTIDLLLVYMNAILSYRYDDTVCT